MILEFLKEIDEIWKPIGIEPITLHVIGSSALLIQMDYVRGTKDTDVLELDTLPSDVWKQLRKLGGKESKMAKKHHLYVDLVKKGILFLPPNPLYSSLETDQYSFKFFKIEVLDPVDVVISKLKTFRPTDIDDIKAVSDRGLLEPTQLIERFNQAKDIWLLGSRAPELKKYVENLHSIQRDFLFCEEAQIELPDWLDSP